MFSKILCLFIALSILSSCKEASPPIPKEEMAIILTELHLAEAFAQLTPVDMGGYQTKNIDSMLLLYNHIYTTHHIDTGSMNTALTWYRQHPIEFNKVYDIVLAELSIRKETQTVDTGKMKFALNWYRQRTIKFDNIYNILITALNVPNELPQDTTAILSDSTEINLSDPL